MFTDPPHPSGPVTGSVSPFFLKIQDSFTKMQECSPQNAPFFDISRRRTISGKQDNMGQLGRRRRFYLVFPTWGEGEGLFWGSGFGAQGLPPHPPAPPAKHFRPGGYPPLPDQRDGGATPPPNPGNPATNSFLITPPSAVQPAIIPREAPGPRVKIPGRYLPLRRGGEGVPPLVGLRWVGGRGGLRWELAGKSFMWRFAQRGFGGGRAGNDQEVSFFEPPSEKVSTRGFHPSGPVTGSVSPFFLKIQDSFAKMQECF